ncbi:MAG: hypothetical protein K6C94_02085 [Candidatus Gastranaerophilales bacterium]|nr:hypothetical protein [Candidatus Gastranaerophilales bacterium]
MTLDIVVARRAVLPDVAIFFRDCFVKINFTSLAINGVTVLLLASPSASARSFLAKTLVVIMKNASAFCGNPFQKQ